MAEAADTQAPIKVSVLSGEVTEISIAALLPVAQLVNGGQRVGVATVSSEVIANFFWEIERLR